MAPPTDIGGAPGQEMEVVPMTIFAQDQHPTDDKSSTWPNGEPQSVRDAYDRQQQKGGQK